MNLTVIDAVGRTVNLLGGSESVSFTGPSYEGSDVEEWSYYVDEVSDRPLVVLESRRPGSDKGIRTILVGVDNSFIGGLTEPINPDPSFMHTGDYDSTGTIAGNTYGWGVALVRHLDPTLPEAPPYEVFVGEESLPDAW